MFTACTIVSNNYLSYARVFARSLRAGHPEADFLVLVVDEPSSKIDYDAELFDVVFASELGIPAFRSFAFRYSILELNTAVKAHFLSYLDEALGASTVCYFDPDILIVDELDELDEIVSRSRLVLTPHILEAIDDDKIPGEKDFLLSGIYNLGFLGIRFDEVTRRFLEWWQERLYLDCRHAVESGLFVDQRWMDFAPAFVDGTVILRKPGYNVAYWNLPHRRLSHESGSWQVNGEPLKFFHFSGFDPFQMEMISKFQNRYRLEERHDLLPLFEEYRGRLFSEGFERLREVPYAYGSFADGTAIPPVAREMLQDTDPHGERWTDPFAVGEGSFQDWLLSPARPDAAVPIPRIAYGVWQRRIDLQRAFPSPLGRDCRRFARWLKEHGGEELPPKFTSRLADLRIENGEERVQPTGRPKTPKLVQLQIPDLDDISLAGADPLDVGGPPFLPRLALEIHRRRPDLQRWFPEPRDAHREAYATWYVTYGRLEYALPRFLVTRALRSLPLRRRLYAGLWWLKHRLGIRGTPGGAT